MNYAFRAIKSLKEKFGRTIIIFAVMITVCTVILSAFSIKSATEKAAIMAREKLGAEVKLTIDMEKVMEQAKQQIETGSNNGDKAGKMKFSAIPIPLEYLDELASSEYVIDYSISSTTGANLKELLAVGAEENEESQDDEEKEDKLMSMGGKLPMASQGDVNLVGVDNFSSYSAVLSGNIELIEGREIEVGDISSNVVMVEETFASENSLQVGSKFTILDSSNENEIEIEVIGVYKSYEEVSEMAYRMPSMLPYNNIYTSYSLVNLLKGDDYDNAVDSMVFHLNDPINIDKFIEEAQNTNIDFETFTIDANNLAYETMVGPIENVASFSDTTLILVMVFGAVILALIIMLSIKDRVNEIGILMALGEKRSKIVSQFVVEVLIVLVVAISIAGAFGNPISNVVGNRLVQNEISVEDDSMSSNNMKPTAGRLPGMNKGDKFTGGSISNIEVVDELDISMSVNDFAKMSILAIILAVIATLIPSISIMRFNPKKILSKHS